MAVTPDDLKTAYLLGRGNSNELTPDMLLKKGWSNEKVMQVLNALVEKRLCALRKNKTTGKAWVRVREEDVAQSVRQLSADDYAVFCCVEEAGMYQCMYTDGVFPRRITQGGLWLSFV